MVSRHGFVYALHSILNEVVGCNFFESQPVLPAIPDIFVLRMILHDWSDKLAVKLLRNLRETAGPNTRLLIIDNIMKFACEALDESNESSTRVPKPLLPNLGGANQLAYEVDMVVSFLSQCTRAQS